MVSVTENTLIQSGFIAWAIVYRIQPLYPGKGGWESLGTCSLPYQGTTVILTCLRHLNNLPFLWQEWHKCLFEERRTRLKTVNVVAMQERHVDVRRGLVRENTIGATPNSLISVFWEIQGLI